MPLRQTIGISLFGLTAAQMLAPQAGQAQNTWVDYTDQSWVWAVGSNVSTGAGIPWPWALGTDSYGNNFAHGNQTDPNVGQAYGASVTITFSGTGIQVTGLTGQTSGVLAYSIDGGPPAFVDNCTAASSGPGGTVDVEGLSSDVHVLNLAVTPYTNCGGTNQGIYGANVINGAPISILQGNSSRFGYNNFTLSGNWTCGGADDGSDISGGHCWSNDPNASLSVTFTGSLVEIFGRPDLENGSFDVYIDNNYSGTVNEQWGSADIDQINSALVYATNLSAANSGQHTLTLVPNVGHPGYLQIDTIVAFGRDQY